MPCSAATALTRSSSRPLTEHRHEVGPPAEYVVAAAAYYDAVALPYHVRQYVERPAVHRALAVAEGRDGKQQFVDGSLLKEVVHLFEHTLCAGHLQQALARVERYAVGGAQHLADGQCATPVLPGYSDNHWRLILRKRVQS